MTSKSLTIPLDRARVIAADIGFTEGPVWTGDGITVTSITRGALYRVDLDGGEPELVATPGGGPNGLAVDPRTGDLWVAQNGRVHMPARASVPDRAPGLQRVRKGVVTQVLTVASGAPNDCAIGPDGMLWFTEPAGDPHGPLRRTGRVWAWDPRSGDRELKLTTDGYPNGLTFGIDGQTVYIAETRHGRVRRFGIDADGHLHEQSVLSLDRGFPDGLAVSDQGHVLVAGTSSGTVEIFDADGEFLERIDFGEASMPTNLCFAGSRLDQLVVTLAKGGRVVAVDAGRSGHPLTHTLHTSTSASAFTSERNDRAS